MHLRQAPLREDLGMGLSLQSNMSVTNSVMEYDLLSRSGMEQESQRVITKSDSQ